MSFYERQEVRDILAYLKLIANHDDDSSLMRIVNTHRSGLGRKLLEKAMIRAADMGISLYSGLSAAVESDEAAGLDEKSRGLIREFLHLVSGFRERFLGGKKMADAARALVEEIDYWGYLVSENKEKEAATWKYRNVESLIGSLADFEEDPDIVGPSLFDYLRRCALNGREDLDEQNKGGDVNIMTIHAAKGLEFPVVFVAGVEEGIIPHMRSVEESEDEEEERRLFYVALTRAKRRLYLTSCSSRRKMGKPAQAFPSPFLDEIPDDCLSLPDLGKNVTQEEAARLFAEARSKFVRE
jgi:DNA helicase-2/ATP-dependent DNA helicase PcrA